MIAISTLGKEAHSQVDNRFGRSEYFVFFNPENGNFTGQENPFSSEGSGAGVRTAQFLAEKNTDILLTGNVGPKAMQVLRSAGIKVCPGASGTAKEALEAFQAGKLKPADFPSVEANFGKGKFRRGRGF